MFIALSGSLLDQTNKIKRDGCSLEVKETSVLAWEAVASNQWLQLTDTLMNADSVLWRSFLTHHKTLLLLDLFHKV